jgi:hypothetical protein
MTLSDFITLRMESILSEWEAFARTLTPAASHMTRLALRDHARQILETAALDISTPQTPISRLSYLNAGPNSGGTSLSTTCHKSYAIPLHSHRAYR